MTKVNMVETVARHIGINKAESARVVDTFVKS